MDSVNNTFIWNDQLRTVQDSLLVKVDSCRRAFQLFHSSDSLLKIAIYDRDTLITTQTAVIKHREKQIVRLKWQKGFIATAGIAVSGFLLYLLIK